MGQKHTGGCLCGKVRFDVELESEQYNICHCGMCRKWSAGPFMAVHGKGGTIEWLNDEGLKWHRSSEWAERGFCSECGTSLFYRLAENPEQFLGVSVESLDDPSGITLQRHIYVDHAPDRYTFGDDRPRQTEAELLVEFGVEPDGSSA